MLLRGFPKKALFMLLKFTITAYFFLMLCILKVSDLSIRFRLVMA